MKKRRRILWLVALAAGILLLLPMTAQAAVSFSDVPITHPFYAEITELADAGIVGGYLDGTFRPDNDVTRMQMAKILVLAMGIHTEPTDNQAAPTFTDVTPDMGVPYPYDFIEEAATAGYFQGDAAGLFGPDLSITRVQLALILVRAGGDALDQPPLGYVTGFTDVPDYAEAEVAIAKYNGILDGKTATNFDPYSAATRGQVCKMVSRLMEKTDVGAVNGTSVEPSTDFLAIAARLNAVLALGYNTINADALAKVLFDTNSANDPVLIDTREPADFANGHIPNSVNIPLKSLPKALLDADPRIPMDKEIVTTSYWGDDGDFAVLLINAYRILDPVAQKAAIDAKTTPPYPKCTTIFQGMTAWNYDRELVPAGTRFEDALASNVRVEKATEAGAVSKTDQGGFPAYNAFGTDDLITKILLRARNYFGSFATQFDMHIYPSVLAQNLEDGNAANNPQIIGVRSTADDEKAHIPGAINIPYQKVADVANFTKFVDPSGPVVAYCYTGHTGGLGTMALGLLGYRVRNVLYGFNGWSTSAPTSGQLKNFDVLRAWDFPVNNGSPQDLDSLADYVPPVGCAGCHDSLTGVFYDREVANIPAAGTAPPSEGEG